MTHSFPTRRSADLLVIVDVRLERLRQFEQVRRHLVRLELLAGGFHHVRPAREIREQVVAGGVAHVQRLSQAVVEVERQPALVHLPQQRSEEHTSELQSLMRISYAVFCLKKKNA